MKGFQESLSSHMVCRGYGMKFSRPLDPAAVCWDGCWGYGVWGMGYAGCLEVWSLLGRLLGVWGMLLLGVWGMLAA